MASCARCGDCCKVIVVTNPVTHAPLTKTMIRRRARTHPSTPFILAHWHRIPMAELDFPHGKPTKPLTYYACDAHNDATGLCDAHADRPPICRDFPWYGKEPKAENLLRYPRCSYWHDIPRDQWPDGVDPLPSPEE